MGMSLGTFGKILDEFFLVLNKLGNVSSFFYYLGEFV